MPVVYMAPKAKSSSLYASLTWIPSLFGEKKMQLNPTKLNTKEKRQSGKRGLMKIDIYKHE